MAVVAQEQEGLGRLKIRRPKLRSLVGLNPAARMAMSQASAARRAARKVKITSREREFMAWARKNDPAAYGRVVAELKKGNVGELGLFQIIAAVANKALAQYQRVTAKRAQVAAEKKAKAAADAAAGPRSGGGGDDAAPAGMSTAAKVGIGVGAAVGGALALKLLAGALAA